MKTRILLLSLLLGLSIQIFAQETLGYESRLPGYKTNFKHNALGENWFINLSAGGQIYNFTDKVTNANLTDRISFIPALALGKWFTPYLGVRLKGEGLSVNSYYPDTGFKQSNDYLNAHVDAMWNIANYFGAYSPAKFFNFTPYVGLGLAHRFKLDNNTTPPPSSAYFRDDYKGSSDAFSINGGIQFGFRLSSLVNLDFDFGITYVGDYFDRINHESENDNILHAMGGFTFNLDNTAFDAIEPMDHALIDNLNGKINALRQENETLSKRPVVSPSSRPECPPVPPQIIKTEINYVPNVVFFRMNSSKVDANQQVSIYNTANFMKDSGGKINVVGYADKDTGTSKYNLLLSEKRAKAVAKELITRYNVPSEKITIEWKGSDEQPYPHNNWNRVVVMSVPK